MLAKLLLAKCAYDNSTLLGKLPFVKCAYDNLNIIRLEAFCKMRLR